MNWNIHMLKRRRWYLIVGAGLLIAIAVMWFSGYPRSLIQVHLAEERGRTKAEEDTRNGHFEIKVYGLARPEDSEFARLAMVKYDVQINFVAGCIVSEDLVAFVKAYNKVSQEQIRSKFGKDIFNECWQEARLHWKVVMLNNSLSRMVDSLQLLVRKLSSP